MKSEDFFQNGCFMYVAKAQKGWFSLCIFTRPTIKTALYAWLFDLLFLPLSLSISKCPNGGGDVIFCGY